MRKVAVALLSGAYILLALSALALILRSGGGVALALTSFAAVAALAFTLHNLIGRNVDTLALRQELKTLRDAHRLLADHIERAQDAVAALGETLQTETAERTEAIVSEVRMLEDLVARMGENLQARLDAYPAAERGGRADRQRSALLETVREALAENRVDLYLQPVVSLPQRKTAFYEGYSRLRDESGRVLMPAQFLEVAEPEGLMSAVDNLLLFRCVQIVRRLSKQERRIGIFCNISPSSLADEEFFPQFLELMARHRDMAGQLIFELGQPAFDGRSSTQARNMARLADLGFRFSVDKVTDLELDFADFARADVKFVKVAAELMLEQLLEAGATRTRGPMRHIEPADFADLARRYGVELIAEKVETERQVIDILDLNIPYGEGHLFGEPRAIREAVLEETAPPPEFLRGPLRRAAGR